MAAAAAQLGGRAGMLEHVGGAGVSPPTALGAGRPESGSRRIVVRRLCGSLEARVPPALGFKSKLVSPEK